MGRSSLLIVALCVCASSVFAETQIGGRPLADELDCSNRPNGLYPNRNDCKTFFQCSNGYSYLYDCPADLHFNPNLLVCDYPENAGCTVGQTEAPTTTTTQAPTTTRAPTPEFDCSDRPSGLYPNPEDCESFYKCSNGYSYLYDCPADLHFNPTLLVCDYPERAGCAAGPETPATEPTVAPTEAPSTRPPTDGFDCSDKPSGLYPNPEDCRTFYKCSNGYSYLYNCPANLHFNPSLLICDYPENAGCSAGQTTPPPTQGPTTSATTRPPTDGFDCSDKPNGLYPNPEDCESFYKCSNGYTYLYQCPAELHFNPSLLVCDYPENAGCTVGPETPATEPTVAPTEAPPSTRPPTDDFDCSDKPSGLYPNPEDCESFYKCSNGYAYLYDCPADLHFNPSLLVCDYPENAGCTVGQTSPAPTTTEEPETTTPPPTDAFDCSGKPNGLYPNPEDCRNFYKCSNGYAYLYDCPANLHFNPVLLICDYPENAGCLETSTTTAPTDPPTTNTTTEESTTTNFPITTKPTEEPTTTEEPSTTDSPTTTNSTTTTEEPSTTDSPTTTNSTTTTEEPTTTDTTEEPSTTEDPTTTEEPSTTDSPTTTNSTTTTEEPSTTDSPTTTNSTTTTEEPSTTDSLTTTEEPTTTHTTEEPTTTDTTEEPTTTEDPTTTEEPITTDSPTTTEVATTTTNATMTTTEAAITTPEADFCIGKPCGTYPDPDNCSVFIQCSDGVATVHQCPEPLLYNPEAQTCDLADRVECSVFSCENRLNGLYQNVKNCHTFYMCSNGYVYLYDCPAQLVYRPDVLYCDWKENSAQFCVNGEL